MATGNTEPMATGNTEPMTADEQRELADVARYWWMPVGVGVLLLIYSFAILSFSMRTVYAIAIALGVGLLLAGVAEILAWRWATSWKWLVLASGIIDIALGIAVLAWPERTFLVLVRLVGWAMLLKGTIDILKSFEDRRLGVDGWWILIVMGIFEIGIAVWAVRYPGRSVVLLVLWVGLTLMTRAITAIVTGFTLRSAGKRAAAA